MLSLPWVNWNPLALIRHCSNSPVYFLFQKFGAHLCPSFMVTCENSPKCRISSVCLISYVTFSWSLSLGSNSDSPLATTHTLNFWEGGVVCIFMISCVFSTITPDAYCKQEDSSCALHHVPGICYDVCLLNNPSGYISCSQLVTEILSAGFYSCWEKRDDQRE